MDKPIILATFSPKKNESKDPGVFNFLIIALAISSSGDIIASTSIFSLANKLLKYLGFK